MKKVLLINNGYPSKEKPQYSTYIKSIKSCLEDAGLEVKLLVLNSNFKGFISKIVNYLNFYLEILFCKDFFCYDFIYLNNYPFVFLPLVFKLKKSKLVIIHWHGTDIEPDRKVLSILNSISYLFLPKKFISISPSKYFATIVNRKLKLNRSARNLISPSGGVDTLIFSPSNNKCFTNKKKAKVIFGFSSSLSFNKGADFILKLSGRLFKLGEICDSELYLKVINYGNQKEYYSKKLSAFNNVFVVDPFPKEEMVEFYNGIDIFLFPTRRSSESLGLVALEAMACGKPVVGTNAFALKEYIIPGVTGELFELDNYLDFEKAIIRAIKNLRNYKPRELVVKKYSKDAVVQQYKQIFYAINE